MLHHLYCVAVVHHHHLLRTVLTLFALVHNGSNYDSPQQCFPQQSLPFQLKNIPHISDLKENPALFGLHVNISYSEA